MKKIKGEFTDINGKAFYKISNYDEMEPFLTMLSTSNDIWVHLSSNGCICAGRESAEKALFPYVSDDKMFHSSDTGVKTFIKLEVSGKKCLWQPFFDTYGNSCEIERNIYKSILGNAVIFEEINKDLGVSFRYRWECCEKYGVVRTASFENFTSEEIEADILDGLLNILPFGVHPTVQANWSCLIDGYKKTEVIKDVQAALFTLTTFMNDTPSPEEMLKANMVWSTAPHDAKVYLDEKVIKRFAKGEKLEYVDTCCGDRGAYILNFKQSIKPRQSIGWQMIADVELDQIRVEEMIQSIQKKEVNLSEELQKSEEELKTILAKGDALQCTGDFMSSAHHMSNVGFNVMRGGLFLNDYHFEYDDFIGFIKLRNRRVLEKHSDFFESIRDIRSILDLKEKAKNTANPDLIRLCYEYLPISFSRRHGDPSRPWNRFSIVLKDKDGKPITNYEGNWRDIFQNWEAMCLSFPEYFESVAAKFLNATTADGFNSYRITTEGIDWERIDPNDPLSSLGYWGDHQIIYFSRILEWFDRFYPQKMDYFIKKCPFSYANIPYELADFPSMIQDPNHTVAHIRQKDDRICDEVLKFGTDYKLVTKDGEIYHVSFAEKLIVPILSKICNLVPGGGIWMNTQRPEWNDANNAIVGFGLSVVTVCHLKRHLSLCIKILKPYEDLEFEISKEVLLWLKGITKVLKQYENYAEKQNFDAKTRMHFLSDAELQFDEYKHTIYKTGFTTGKEKTEYAKVIEFLRLCEKYIDSTLAENRREDRIFHSYNVMEVKGDGLEIKHLKPMLEGQVAVLGCDYLSDQEVCGLLEAMENSGLYSEKEHTYYLYPVIHTKPFLDKNIIRKELAEQSELVMRLLDTEDKRLLQKDCYGNIRFRSNINSYPTLKEVLEKLLDEYPELVHKEYDMILGMFEDTFRHGEFMGRSEVMYKYEGIGCVYWHQNSKLLVSVEERMLAAGADMRPKLMDAYRRVRNGLGFHKSPEEWGAFPTDAYSHTPFDGGAKQPGMTGQVKEEIITRFTELGVIIKDGKIKFDGNLVDESEFLHEATEFEFIGMAGNTQKVILPQNGLAFTFCQTPIIYVKSSENRIDVEFANGDKKRISGNTLSEDLSESVFSRAYIIKRITVNLSIGTKDTV